MKKTGISLRLHVGIIIISLCVIAMLLILASGWIYANLAYNNRQAALVETIELKTRDLITQLEQHSRDLGLTVQQPAKFRSYLTQRNIPAMVKHLDNQFHQYFVTADVLKLEKLYIYDEYLSLLAQSTEGDRGIRQGDVACPGLIMRAKRRHGPRRLQPIAEICMHEGTPYHGMVVPIGGLKVTGYIAVITNPAFSLRRLESELGLPVRLSVPLGAIVFQSKSWSTQTDQHSKLTAEHLLRSHVFEPALQIAVSHNAQALASQLASTRILISLISIGTLVVTALFAFMTLYSQWINPWQKLKRYLHLAVRDKSMLKEPIEIEGSIDMQDMARHIAALTGELGELHHSIEHLGLVDELTELPNLPLFQDRLLQNILSAERNKSNFGLLIIGLRRFREINETYGRDTGDKLLQQVSQRISQVLRKSDTLARLTERTPGHFASDLFAAVLPSTGSEQSAVTVAQKIQRTMEHTFNVEGHTVQVDISIGISLYPDHGSDPQTLMQRADIAMHQAKHNQQGFAIYDSSHDNPSLSRLTMISDLRRAIESDELSLVFQPKIDIKSSQIIGVETLVRWTHPQHGVMPLSSFLPLAEHTGLIKPLTKWVLQNACAACRQLHEIDYWIHTTVNVSVRNLLDSSLPETVLAILESNALDSQWLFLELTESAVMSNSSRAQRILERLHQAGIHLVVDDFGTGHSSLTTLKKLPVSEIKIDRSFVLEMKEDNNDTVIVRATIDLAHNMGLLVTAEGVDTEEVWHLLKILGCDIAQGNYICPPMSLEKLLPWIAKWEWGCATPALITDSESTTAPETCPDIGQGSNSA